KGSGPLDRSSRPRGWKGRPDPLTMTAVMIHTDQYMTSVITTQGSPARPAQPPVGNWISVKPATVTDTPAVLDMVGRCSAVSLFHRFHGPSDGLLYTRALLAGQSIDETLVAWHGDACVGLATLSRDRDGASHLGVLVEDAWQRRGVGRRLVSAL